jgi:hypothetical protein
MSGQEIEVTIATNGTVKIEAKGTVGKACESLTKPYEDAIGARMAVARKPEYNQTVQATAQRHAGQ